MKRVLIDKSITRRSLVAGIGGVALGGAAIGVLGRSNAFAQVPGKLEGDLVIVDTGGTTSDAHKALFYDPFSKETGVRVHVVSVSSSPEAFAKLRAAQQVNQVEWDVVTSAPATMLTDGDLLAKIPCDQLPNSVSQGSKGSCTDTGMLKFGYGGAIAYNSKKFPNGQHPKNWADFYDTKKFPGPRAFSNVGTPWEILLTALMADGIPADESKLFPMDVDRAFKKLDQIKSSVAVWYTTGAQQQQILKDEEVVLAYCWSGRALALKAQGLPIDVEWNQAILANDYWSIAKSAPHPNAALAFLNYFTGHPEAHVEFAKLTSYYGPNAKAAELLPGAGVTAPPSAMTMVMDYDWIAKNRNALVTRFDTWLAT